jgi:hypothetical protein
LGDLRRRFNEDSVSERREERFARRSESEDFEEEVGRGTFDGEAVDSDGRLPFCLF